MKPSTPSGSKEVKNLSDDLGPNTKAKATKNQRVLGILDHTSPIRNAYSVEETIFKRFAEIELQQENHVWIRMGNHTHPKSMQSMIKTKPNQHQLRSRLQEDSHQLESTL